MPITEQHNTDELIQGGAWLKYGDDEMGMTEGLKVTLAETIKESKCDQFLTAVKRRRTALEWKVTAVIKQHNLERFAALSGFELEVDGTDTTKKRVVINAAAGENPASGKVLTLTAIDDEDDDITMLNAEVEINWEWSYEMENDRAYEVTFVAMPDSTGKLGYWGDADVVVA